MSDRTRLMKAGKAACVFTLYTVPFFVLFCILYGIHVAQRRTDDDGPETIAGIGIVAYVTIYITAAVFITSNRRHVE